MWSIFPVHLTSPLILFVCKLVFGLCCCTQCVMRKQGNELEMWSVNPWQVISLLYSSSKQEPTWQRASSLTLSLPSLLFTSSLCLLSFSAAAVHTTLNWNHVGITVRMIRGVKASIRKQWHLSEANNMIFSGDFGLLWFYLFINN